jgi:hypothetical protein
MFKIFLAATVIGALSTALALPGSGKSMTLTDFVVSASLVTHQSAKADKLDTPAEATVRNFVSPRQNGNRVAFCSSSMTMCGKETADVFCRRAGFTEAKNFQRDGVQSHSARLMFRQIKCANVRLASS